MPEAPPGFAVALAERIAAQVRPLAVLMFGSWSKGIADIHSDLDLIVVLDRPPTPALRGELADAAASVPVGVDLLFWTPRDVAAARSDPHGFPGSALQSAVTLYSRSEASPLLAPRETAGRHDP